MSTETSVEQTASAPAPVETAAPAPADEAKELELGSTDTPADAAETPEPDGERRNKVPAKQRINQLTRDKRQLESKLTELETKLQDFERRIQPQEPKEPKLAEYDNDADFVAAVHQYHKDKASFDSTKVAKQESEAQAAQRKQEEQQKAGLKFVTDLQREKENYEGIEAVMKDETFAAIVNSMPSDLLTLIQTSEKNVALAYYLGTHLDEADDIATLAKQSPTKAARALAHLESRLEIPKPKTVSNAPPPVKKVAGSSVVEKDINDPKLPYKEFVALREKQIAARRRR